MSSVTTDAIGLLAALGWGSPTVPWPSPIAGGKERSAISNEEVADPGYRTAYDYYMIDREARALRRTHLHSVIVTTWKRVLQRIGGRLAAGNRDLPAPLRAM